MRLIRRNEKSTRDCIYIHIYVYRKPWILIRGINFSFFFFLVVFSWIDKIRIFHFGNISLGEFNLCRILDLNFSDSIALYEVDFISYHLLWDFLLHRVRGIILKQSRLLSQFEATIVYFVERTMYSYGYFLIITCRQSGNSVKYDDSATFIRDTIIIDNGTLTEP